MANFVSNRVICKRSFYEKIFMIPILLAWKNQTNM